METNTDPEYETPIPHEEAARLLRVSIERGDRAGTRFAIHAPNCPTVFLVSGTPIEFAIEADT